MRWKVEKCDVFGCSLKKFQFQPSGSAALFRCDQHLYMFGAAITHSDNTDLGLPVVDPLFKVSDSVFGN